MRRILIILCILFSVVLPLSALNATAQTSTITYTPSGDTYTSSSAPTTNYATNATMLTLGGGSITKYSLISLSICPEQTPTAVRFFVYNNTPGSGTLSLKQVSSFNEGTVTYNTMPTILSDVLATNNAATAGWLSFTIPVANLDGCNGYFVISGDGAQTQLLATQSTQTTRRPYFEVDFSTLPTNTPIPPTSTPTNTTVPPTNTPTSIPTNTAVVPTSTPQPTATSIPTATCTTLPVTVDTYINQGAPNTNYGTNVSVRVEGGNAIKAGLVTLPTYSLGVGETVASVTFRMWVTTAGNGTVLLYDTDAAFNEATVTWNTQPGFSNQLGSVSGSATGWVEFSVTNYYVNGGRNLSLLPSGDVTAAIVYRSSDSSSGAKPEVIVCTQTSATNTPIPSTATNTPIPPTNTPTYTPTATNTVVPPTATNTDVPPTETSTLIPTSTPTQVGTVTNITFPARATFYYPWFPGAWTQGGIYPYTKYNPTLGFYDQTLSDVQNHIDAMQYGNIDVGIASWWGQGTREDQKVPMLLQAASGTSFRWAFYYEDEGFGNPTQETITSDLNYLIAQYGTSPNVAKINGRVVVFVYNADDTTCSVVDRWKAANAVPNAYIVMKVFPNYTSCTNQPDGWHQYGPDVREDQQGSYSFSIAPGFYKADAVSPLLTRDPNLFDDNVRNMVASGAQWQLIISFNEWGEGTSVESASEWSSTSGYGIYLDILHLNGQGGVPPTSTPTNTPIPTNTATGPTPTMTSTPSGNSITFAAVGDISCASTGTCHTIASQVCDLANQADTILVLGDDQYESGTTTEYTNYWNTSTCQDYEGKTYPSVGNHQYNTANAAGYDTHWGSKDGTSGKFWYAQQINGVNLIVVNSNCSKVACTVGSEQYNFVSNQLTTHTNSCNILIDHHPRYSSGVTHGSTTSMDPIWDLFYNQGGDLFLSGHEHNYERFAPQGASNNATPNGVIQFVNGNGGKDGSNYTIGPPIANSVVQIFNNPVNGSRSYGVLFITVTDTSYTFQYVDIDGDVLDSGSGTCH